MRWLCIPRCSSLALKPKFVKTDYPVCSPIQTRWSDNDIYGHLNNVVYYSYFDTIVNRFLLDSGILDIDTGSMIGLVVETGCNYFSPLGFPQELVGGLGVSKIGSSSVRYQIGIFQANIERPSAEGHFVHVYVDKGSRRPMPIPDTFRSQLETILVAENN